jgi:hypothetical protein
MNFHYFVLRIQEKWGPFSTEQTMIQLQIQLQYLQVTERVPVFVSN